MQTTAIGRRSSTPPRIRALVHPPVVGSAGQTRAAHRCCSCCRARASAGGGRLRKNLRPVCRQRVGWDCQALCVRDVVARVFAVSRAVRRIPRLRSRDCRGRSRALRDAESLPAVFRSVVRLIAALANQLSSEICVTPVASQPVGFKLAAFIGNRQVKSGCASTFNLTATCRRPSRCR